jgi:Tfp pilus assembly protein PilX
MVVMTPSNEKGIALVFTLFLMGALSALAVSLMFLSQTETSSTRNYRTMSQARYAGEAGVHKAINYLINTYAGPGSLSNYNLTASPVTCASGCTTTGPVILSGVSGVSANYPDSTVAAAFSAAVQGTLATNVDGIITNAANGTVTYGASAKLMSMRQVTEYGGTTLKVVQTWQITADGTVPGTLPATVEVTALLERDLVDAETYAVFATGAGCGAIDLRGNAGTNSYDSTAPLVSGAPVTTSSGGNVGTNGNLTVTGSVAVHGSLSTPRTGVGSCTTGAVDALTSTGSATVSAGTIQLPQSVAYPTPANPSPWPPLTAATIGSSTAGLTCALAAGISVSLPSTCTAAGGVVTITANGMPLSIGNLTMNNGTLNIVGGTNPTVTMNINSITLGGNANLTMATGTTVIMNVAGRTAIGSLATPVDLTGGADINPSFDPTRLQILYAGTGELKLTGNNTLAATIYAPNAAVSTHGNGQIYGSILSSTFIDAGNTNFHYDRNLQKKYKTLGNFVMTSFSWKKY